MNDILRRQAEARQREPADTFFDSLIAEMPEHADAQQCEKGPIFRSARTVVRAAIAIFVALVFAIAVAGCGGGVDVAAEEDSAHIPTGCSAFPRPPACI